MSIVRQVQTMHLVEALAVALYQYPAPRLAGRPWLQEEFARFAEGEIRHRALFAALLAERGASPWWWARVLAVIVGAAAWLVVLLLGPWWLLRFEILIERIAIAHYGKILAGGLPADIAALVRGVQADERAHLAQMRALLTRRGPANDANGEMPG
jgi:rubrerythrin